MASKKPVKVEELVAKKLTLWHTRTFRPIMTHDELEPLMSAAGFVPLPLQPPPPPEGQKQPAAFAWREYASRLEAAGGGRRKGRRRHAAVLAPPRPRLPHPRIDGLHLKTYKAFFLALEFYLGPTLVPNLFHVRCAGRRHNLFNVWPVIISPGSCSRTMPLAKAQDRGFEKAYRPMKDCEMGEEGILVYRDGTLDPVTRITCSRFGGDEIDDVNDQSGNAASVVSGGAVNLSCFVPLKDLFPTGGLSSR
ncbi:hypothetical protein ZIOFF_067759 [Zingiber officinale]|uniref:Uncharacterized protein n=1 Tax=Zingiber officinale TaxID=94328 RepID=A0A8J5CG53_ZINOF|nr:hypothetical protein ZIOFF_067759 [Zingiber officinale]